MNEPGDLGMVRANDRTAHIIGDDLHGIALSWCGKSLHLYPLAPGQYTICALCFSYYRGAVMAHEGDPLADPAGNT